MLRAPATTFLTHTVYIIGQACIVGQACMHLIIRTKCFDDRRVCECGCLSDQFTKVARGVATFVAPHPVTSSRTATCHREDPTLTPGR